MSGADPLVSVVVPARDCEATIGATLAGLAGQDLEGSYEVIVVDNGSDDRTAEIAQASGARVVRRPRGDGPGAARDAGVSAARAALIAFTDADAVPEPAWLREGVAALDDADLVQGSVRPDPRTPPGPLDRTVRVDSESGLYETANLFVRRATFERAHGFGGDGRGEGEGAPFGEDVAFAWRARRAGARTRFAPDAVVHHAVFRRDWRGYVAEARRRGRFAALAREVPELREHFFYRRWFLSRRSAAFAAAAAGCAIAAAARSRWPLAAAVPYTALVSRDADRSLRWAAVRVAADAVGAGSLIAGSARARSPVL